MESTTAPPGRLVAVQLAQEPLQLRLRQPARAIDQLLALVLLGERHEVEQRDAEAIGEHLQRADGRARAAVLDVAEVALRAELALEGELLAGEAGRVAQLADALADAPGEWIGELSAGHGAHPRIFFGAGRS